DLVGVVAGDLAARDIDSAVGRADADVYNDGHGAGIRDRRSEIGEFLALGVRGPDDKNAFHRVPSPARGRRWREAPDEGLVTPTTLTPTLPRESGRGGSLLTAEPVPR